MQTVFETNLDEFSRRYPSRHEIIDFIINDFPEYYANEDYLIKLETINKHLNCGCTDCGGKDSVSQCKIEELFFEKINEWILI